MMRYLVVKANDGRRKPWVAASTDASDPELIGDWSNRLTWHEAFADALVLAANDGQFPMGTFS